MRKSTCTEGQIVQALRQAKSGTSVADICRKLNVSETTVFRWKKQYGSLGTPEIRELRALREETRRLKQLVADLSLGKTILQESLRKNGEAGAAPDVGGVSAGALRAVDVARVSGDGRSPVADDTTAPPAGAGSSRTPAAARARGNGRALRVPAAPRAAAWRRWTPRGLGGQPQARVPAPPPGGAHAQAPPSDAAQERRPA